MNFRKFAILGMRISRGYANLIGLTPARLDFVSALRDGALAQREIAARLCVTDGAVSRMVRKLMEIGFVQRHVPVDDERYRMVSLTLHGRTEYDHLAERWFVVQTPLYADAQCIGEGDLMSRYYGAWDRLGLAFLAQIFQGDRPGAEKLAEPPWEAFRYEQRIGLDADPIDGITIRKQGWPLTFTPPERPPLEGGVVDDPLSVALLARKPYWWRADGTPRYKSYFPTRCPALAG